MFTKSASLLVAVLATAATATTYKAPLHPGALAAKRDLVARQSSDDASSATSCLAEVLSVYSSIPTPPPAIVSWEETATFTDVCSISIPASLSAAFSSYESEFVSWYTAHSAELSSALSDCPQLTGQVDTSSIGPAVCTATGAGGAGATTDDAATETSTATTTTKAGLGGGATTTATGTGSSASGSGTATAASSSHNAGPRETGFIGAAVAAAGFLGVIAAL